MTFSQYFPTSRQFLLFSVFGIIYAVLLVDLGTSFSFLSDSDKEDFSSLLLISETHAEEGPLVNEDVPVCLPVSLGYQGHEEEEKKEEVRLSVPVEQKTVVSKTVTPTVAKPKVAVAPIPKDPDNPNSVRIHISQAPLPASAKKVNGRWVCAVKNDKPHKSNKTGKVHIDRQCCLDPDEIPNPHCDYSYKEK